MSKQSSLCAITTSVMWMAYFLIILHVVTGSSVVVPALSSWRDCAEHALTSGTAALRPPVRGELMQSRRPNPTTHIVATRSRVADLAASACPGTHQPTLVFTTIGGFGDRLRGMVTAYYAALLTHAQFRVSWTVPSPIAPFFDIDPALLWEEDETRSPDNNAEYAPFATHLAIPGSATVDVIDIFKFFTDPASDFVTGLAPPANGTVTVLRTNAPSWIDVVRHPTLRKVADLYGLTDLSRRDLFVLAVQAVLRRPAPPVIEAAVMTLPQSLQAPVSSSLASGFGKGQDYINVAGGRIHAVPTKSKAHHHRRGSYALTPSGHPDGDALISDNPATSDNPAPPLAIIGVQIRTGGVGEAWADARRHSVNSARCFADRAREVCVDVHAGACFVFLTADSRAAVDVFVGAMNGTGIGVAQTNGPILHTDRGVPASLLSNASTATITSDPWLKTYADWVALSQSDVLLMSHSGYGLTAAWAGGVPHVWQLREGDACEWVRLDDCAELPM